MTSPQHALFLDVSGRRVVVVGGGPVAARRATRLVEDGADVLVVAPALCEDLTEHVAAGRLTWRAREYLTTDLDGAWLVHTATGDRAVDDAVAADAEAVRLWCVRADDATASSAWTPAVEVGGQVLPCPPRQAARGDVPVSYTHLTLPTILLV